MEVNFTRVWESGYPFMQPSEGSAGATGVGVCVLVAVNGATAQCYCNVFYADVLCTPDLNNVSKGVAPARGQQ